MTDEASAHPQTPPRTPITIALIVIGTLIFFVNAKLGEPLFRDYALWPLANHFMPWQLLSHAFLHGSITHLFFNLYGLYLFGAPIEACVGRSRYLSLLAGSAITAGIVQLIANAWEGNANPTVGASGALFGVMYVYARLFPKHRILLILPPIPLPAWLFVLLYGLLELYLGISGQSPQIAHFAHLGGLLGGALLFALWRTGRPAPPPTH